MDFVSKKRLERHIQESHAESEIFLIHQKRGRDEKEGIGFNEQCPTTLSVDFPTEGEMMVHNCTNII